MRPRHLTGVARRAASDLRPKFANGGEVCQPVADPLVKDPPEQAVLAHVRIKMAQQDRQARVSVKW